MLIEMGVAAMAGSTETGDVTALCAVIDTERAATGSDGAAATVVDTDVTATVGAIAVCVGIAAVVAVLVVAAAAAAAGDNVPAWVAGTRVCMVGVDAGVELVA